MRVIERAGASISAACAISSPPLSRFIADWRHFMASSVLSSFHREHSRARLPGADYFTSLTEKAVPCRHYLPAHYQQTLVTTQCSIRFKIIRHTNTQLTARRHASTACYRFDKYVALTYAFEFALLPGELKYVTVLRGPDF